MSGLVEFGYWTKNVVSGLFLLPAGPLVLIAIGLLTARRRRRTGFALILVGWSTLVAFSMPIVAGALALSEERSFPPLGADVALPADAAIVILAGGMQTGATDYGGETVNSTTLARLRSGARLAARTHLPVLVTGGVPLRVRTSEAEQMVDALERDFHTPVRWIEKASLDTHDNARLSVPLLKADGVSTAILVTDVGHMRRSKALFEAAGIVVIPAPTDFYAHGPITVLSFMPNGNALRRSAWSLHEWLGLVWSRLVNG